MQTFAFALTFFFYLGVYNYLNIVILTIGIFVYLFFFITYTLTCIKDPGIITPDYYMENYDVDKMKLENYRICKTCNAIRDLDRGVEHCIDCDVCIIGNDHHCPWSSKCVGKKNIFVFRLFTYSIFFHIGYLLFAFFILAITADLNKKNKK